MSGQVIITDRPVSSDEAFEFSLDEMMGALSGVIEIGLVLKQPSGTGVKQRFSQKWLIAENDPDISTNRKDDKSLMIGDTVGVLRQHNGNVHFFVNGIKHDTVLTGVPANVYGMVTLPDSTTKGNTSTHQSGTVGNDMSFEMTNSATPTTIPKQTAQTRATKPNDESSHGQPASTSNSSIIRNPKTHVNPPMSGMTTLMRRISETEPHYWDAVQYKGSFVNVVLPKTSDEYRTVKKKFVDSGGPNKVEKIERIQNREMFQRYVFILGQLKNKRPWITEMERTLYHGTRADVIASINTQGFNRNFAGKNATRYGKGTYFAIEARYSSKAPYSVADEEGLHYVYQCRVIVGQSCLGRDGMVQPDPLTADNPLELHDSAVDTMEKPQMFVVFRDDRAYPEYLITFR